MDRTNPPSLLLIEDNPEQLRLLFEALRDKGYRLITATDGAQGYARAVALRPDLILLDVRMPKMDGYTLARMLKAEKTTRHIPILFLSVLSDADDKLAGFESGGVDYILKPFHAAEVVERVRVHLELAQKSQEAEGAGAGAHAERSPVQDRADIHHRHRVLFEAIITLLEGRLDDPPGAKELAERLGVSERRIVRTFKVCQGMTLSEYVRQERMRQAAHLLSTTLLSISDIANETGYSNPANFATAFREFHGETPSRYRKKV